MSVGRADALPMGGGLDRFKETVTIRGGNEKGKSNGKIPEVARFSRQRERGSIAGGAEGFTLTAW